MSMKAVQLIAEAADQNCGSTTTVGGLACGEVVDVVEPGVQETRGEGN